MNLNNKKSSSSYYGFSGYKKKTKKEPEKVVVEPDTGRYRWAVEFMAGPGGYMEKAEVVSAWFPCEDEAREDAMERAQREVDDYPFSRHRILKLIVEEENGKIIVLSNAKDVPSR